MAAAVASSMTSMMRAALAGFAGAGNGDTGQESAAALPPTLTPPPQGGEGRKAERYYGSAGLREAARDAGGHRSVPARGGDGVRAISRTRARVCRPAGDEQAWVV